MRAGKRATLDITGDEVREAELGEVVARRQAALGQETDSDGVRENLVGLALSGGGVRAGALSLGLLQAFYRRGVLKFVDYLSTVSGGGYAGAHLSSVSLLPPTKDVSPADDATDGSPDPVDETFPIADRGTGQQSERMLDFIYGGTYLKRTWLFVNRYLIGLVAAAVFVISGLVLLASGTAWVFRSLDYPAPRSWLRALGFEGDAMLAFFPSFVLFIFWVIAWAISYWRNRRKCRGTVAQFLLYGLAFTTAVAVAMLFGNGQVSVGSMLQRFGLDEIPTAWQSGVRIALLLGIGMALLPYLNPSRLIKSGTTPRNAVERYVFWVATRAMVYGVPFIFIAWFARENISGFNTERTPYVTRSEIKDWTPNSRIWRELLETKGQLAATLSPMGTLWQQERAETRGSDSARVTPKGERVRCQATERACECYVNLIEMERLLVLAESDDELLTEIQSERRLVLDQIEGRLGDTSAPSSGLPDEVDYALESRQLLGLSRPDSDAAMPFYERWLHVPDLFLSRALGMDDGHNNPLRSMYLAHSESRRLRTRLAAMLNMQLKDAGFYKRFIRERDLFNRPDEATSNPDAIRNTLPPTTDPSDESQGRVVASRAAAGAGTAGVNQTPAAFEKVWPEIRQYHLVEVDGQPVDDEKIKKQVLRRLQTAWANAHAVASFQDSSVADPPKPQGSGTAPAGTSNAEDRRATRLALLSDEEKIEAVVAANRALLEAFYGNLIGDRTTVYSSVVLAADQEERAWWCFWSLILFVLFGLFTDLNATSWHGFYSQLVGSAWVEKVPGLEGHLPLAQLETTRFGRPYHLISACVHRFDVLGRARRGPRAQFLFSWRYCGSDDLAYNPTDEYMDGKFSLEDAIAVSGAAVSPAQTANPLVIALLFIFNIRLGQWLDNPVHAEWRARWVERLLRLLPATPLRVFGGLLRDPKKRSLCFVSDGGHFENLGIKELLKRRCRLIIAFDAGQDPEYRFDDLVNLTRWARVGHGIRIRPVQEREASLSLYSLTPEPETGLSLAHYQIARIYYPDDPAGTDPAWLIYMKSSLTGDESPELLRRGADGEFPHDSTADQFYDPPRFESYRQLGDHIARNVLDRMPKSFGDSDEALTDDFIRALVGEGLVDSARIAKPVAESADGETDETIAALITTLANEQEAWRTRGTAAGELADRHAHDPRALDALVAALDTQDTNLAEQVGIGLVDVGAPTLDRLVRLLSAEAHAMLPARIISEILHNEPEGRTDTATAIVDVLTGLPGKLKTDPLRMVLLNALRPVVAAANSAEETNQLRGLLQGYRAQAGLSSSVRTELDMLLARVDIDAGESDS